jgi:ribosomal-protein-alanine N-acetyltransferase
MGPFETDRLILRNVEAADVPALKELIYSDREVWGQYSGLGDKPALLERAFANHVSQDDDAEFGRLAVVLKASGQTIGQVHLDPYVNIWYRVAGDPETPVSNIEVELAFAFGKAHWGQGYAFEACQALVDYAFNQLKLPRLVGGAKHTNDRSVRLQKRLGFDAYQDEDPDAPGRSAWVSVLNNPLAA